MATKTKNNDFMQKAGIAVGAAAIGAAVGAAAVAMTDPAIKKKVIKEIKDLESKVGKGMKNIKEQVEEKKEELVKKVS